MTEDGIQCVSASNADPKERWDEIELYADKDFSPEFVPNSAIMYNRYYSFKSVDIDEAQRLGNRILDFPGTTVGYKVADGEVRGGELYYVNVSVMVLIHFVEQ